MLNRSMLVAAAVALLAPAAAGAQSKPGVTTGGVSNVTFSSATLNGSVDPNRAATSYFFQYGTTRLAVTNTAAAAASGRKPRAVSIAIAGLAPLTRYHYRLVAQNGEGSTIGKWRAFTSRRQPLGVTLAANPNPVAPGGATTLGGQLTGSNSAGRDVVLQGNPFPYTQGFLNVGNAQVTDPAGNFSFNLLSVPVNTQFRVVLAQRPEVTSPIVVVGAALQVKTRVKKVDRHRHSVSVRFRGGIRPQNDGGRVAIQKFRNNAWVEIAHTRAKDAGSSKSRFRTRVRIYRSGLFRAVAETEGQYSTGAGRAIPIRVRR